MADQLAAWELALHEWLELPNDAPDPSPPPPRWDPCPGRVACFQVETGDGCQGCAGCHPGHRCHVDGRADACVRSD